MRRGFAVDQVIRHLALDPRTVAAGPVPGREIRVASLTEATEHAEALFRLYAEARSDVPSATPRPVWTRVEWLAETIDSLLIDVDASVVVFEHDHPVALA